ncbi:MAG: response regulator transcription factor [Flavobacteriales bacterium]
MQGTRIGIFDDHPAVGEALSRVFTERGADVRFCARTKDRLLEQLALQRPDVLILDVVAEDVIGIEMFRLIGERYPSLPLIAYTSLGSPMLVENLMRAGARAYVCKTEEMDALCAAVSKVVQGKVSLPREYAFLHGQGAGTEGATLSEREIEILRMIAREQTSKEIAEHLGLSVNTVENHRQHIFSKLNVRNLAGLIVEGFRHGYLTS